MRRKKNELRVFKLRSGEEIIAKVAGKSKDKIKLHRPMRIMENYQTDPFTGSKRQIVFFSDWLGCTSEMSAEIPLDFIVVELSPDPDIISLYSRQIEIQDTNGVEQNNKGKADLGDVSDEELQKLSDEIDDKLEQMLKQLAQQDSKKPPVGGSEPKGSSGPPNIPPIPGFPFPFMPPSGGMPRLPNSILFSVSIPQEIMASWVESGFIDYLKDSVQDFMSTDFLEEMMNDDTDEVPQKPKKKKNKREKISKDEWAEPSDDLKKKPNYGNSHEDWSPYLKDYLPQPEPPKSDPPKNEDEG